MLAAQRTYPVSKKSIVYSEETMKIGHDFLDLQ